MTDPRPMIVTHSDWAEYAAPSVTRSRWSVVVAAAGRGTRLGFDLPKILYPIAGRTILEWLTRLLLPNCETMVFVLSPEGRRHVEPELKRLAPGRFQVAIQDVPSGMGDATAIGADCVETPDTAVIWGDQVAIRGSSIESIFRLHEGPVMPDLTIPTVLRSAPYIHFERDPKQRICRLLQFREGDSMPPSGESDAGLFCFRSDVLRHLLKEMRHQAEAIGAKTGEFNLLPLIPLASARGYRILSPRLLEEDETIGINSPADAERIEPYLWRING